MAPVMSDMLPVTPLASHQYSVTLEQEWVIGTVPNGGYITSTFIIIARTHMQLVHSSRKQPHVVNLHLQFLRPTDVGSAILKVKDIKIGARVSNLHITLAQKKDPDSEEYTDEAEGYITMTNIHSESGLTLETGYKLVPEPLPVSLSALSEDRDKNYRIRPLDPFADFRPATGNMRIHIMRPSQRPSDYPQAMIDQWVRFTPRAYPGECGKWTNDAIGFVADMFPQVIETLIVPKVAESVFAGEVLQRQMEKVSGVASPTARFWYPTLNLNLDIKKVLPEEGVDWLFARIQAKRIENGRFDLLVEIFDEKNDLVATSTHTSLAVDASRNLIRNKKKKSKI